MQCLVVLVFSLHSSWVMSSPAIRDSVIVNRLQPFAKPSKSETKNVQPVGNDAAKKFLPLTELPAPLHQESGRRHLPENCIPHKPGDVVYDGTTINIHDDYYDEKVAKTVATIIFPDHIDHKHFEVTTQVPYFTVGPIEAIGFHPSIPSIDTCERIYQDHMADVYSGSSGDYSEESLEVARMPLYPSVKLPKPVEEESAGEYSDFK